MNYPSDWPAPEGPIDLERHDLPHASSALEWWYVNAHVEAGGREYSLFASFFRSKLDGRPEDSPERALSLTWALVDAEGERYLPVSLLDPTTPEQALLRLDRPGEVPDPHLRRAMRELFEAGEVPLPDQKLEVKGQCATDRLFVEIGGQTFTKLGPNRYELVLECDARGIGARVVFELEKEVVRHGDRGVVRGVEREEMFYYFCPRCAVTGTVTVDGEEHAITSGSGWYDHEFGKETESKDDEPNPWVGWNWLSAQLDGGWEVSAYDLFAENEEESRGHWLILIDPDGNREAFEDFEFIPVESWTSAYSFATYPIHWKIVCPSAGLELTVTPSFAEQEFVTIMSRPGFWEGRVEVSGSLQGAERQGRGFVERRGPDPARFLKGFFKAVGARTRDAITGLVPREPDAVQAARIAFGPGDADRFIEGVDLGQMGKAALAPLRDVVDRGGKAWRSYGLLACATVVGGDPQPFIDWLAVPELLHTGSLLVDDVQDGSEVRRGGPAAHLVHGDGLAINSGCLAYFLGQLLDYDAPLTDAQRIAVYRHYFEALRAGHVGQALDIDGLHVDLDAVVASGESDVLAARVLATHRLKSAAPVGSVGRIGAVLGGATGEQVELVGRYLEQLGLAFQVVDDVLNLRGFERDLKTRGEDLIHGKITYPVALALGKLELEDRRWLTAQLSEAPPTEEDLARMIEMIEVCGALEEAAQFARQIVEDAWRELDPHVEASQAKVKLRAFGWFVLDRQY